MSTLPIEVVSPALPVLDVAVLPNLTVPAAVNKFDHEVPFEPEFGSNISSVLFENVDETAAITIKDEIENSIENFEPRVSLIDVEVEPDYDNNELIAKILYTIVGIDVPPQQLEFVLLPTR